MNRGSMTKTYVHQFSNGLIATATLALGGFSTEWSDMEKSKIRAILNEYFVWRDSIVADFAKLTGKTITVADWGRTEKPFTVLGSPEVGSR